MESAIPQRDRVEPGRQMVHFQLKIAPLVIVVSSAGFLRGARPLNERWGHGTVP